VERRWSWRMLGTSLGYLETFVVTYIVVTGSRDA
jgi:hypothetical protein